MLRRLLRGSYSRACLIDQEFIDNSLDHRRSPGISRQLVVEDEDDPESIAARYVARAKRARLGPAPYEEELSSGPNGRRHLFPKKARDVDDSTYQMYMIKV